MSLTKTLDPNGLLIAVNGIKVPSAIAQVMEDVVDSVAGGGGGGGAITITSIEDTEIDLGELEAGPYDLDLSEFTGNVFKFSCPTGGSIVRSIKRPALLTNETITLKNYSASVKPSDGVLVLTQDDPDGVYEHIHLEGRQPWHVIPSLGSLELRKDAGQNKWWARTPLAFGNQMRPIAAIFEIPDGVVDDLDPDDVITGLSGKYANLWRCVPAAGTILTGIDVEITAGSNWNRVITAIDNGGAECTIAHANSNGGASTYEFRCPGEVDLVWKKWATVRFIYDAENTFWIVEG